MDDFDKLDDDALQLVLEELTLQELLSRRTVSDRFQVIINKICRAKTSLNLFFSTKAAQCFHRLFACASTDGDLILENEELSDPSVCTDFPSYFLQLQHLTVYHSQIDLPFLLDSWPQLTSLSLLLENNDLISLIWSRLESMTSLKHLHLFSNSYTLPEEMPFLSRLEKFSLVNYHPNMTKVLKQLTSSCTHLYLDNFLSAIWEMEELGQENAELMGSVTHLTLGNIGQSYCSFVDDTRNNLKNISRFVGQNFVNLEYLNIRFTFEKLPLSDLLPELCHLNSLTEFHFALKDPSQLRELSNAEFQGIETVKVYCGP